jgi:hypothetical protein
MLDRTLSDRRATLVERWLRVVLDTYSEEAARSMRREVDQFANPAGHLMTTGIAALFDELIAGAREEQAAPILEEMLKLRALQDFAPSKAVGFVGAVKQVLRTEPDMSLTAAQWDDLNARVDRLQMCAFEVYMRCRERVYEVRYNQLKKMNYTMLERANRMFGASLAAGAKGSVAGESDDDNRGEDR